MRIGNNKKRACAKHQDLPVGLYERTYFNIKNGIRYDYVAISGICTVKSKVVFFSRNFGNKRTREQAIKEVVEWRENKFMENK